MNAKSLSYEIIVSSNSLYSADKIKELQGCHPYVNWRFNETNTGFAGGMNAGINLARGNCVAIVNPDVIVLSGLRAAYDYLFRSQNVGLIGPQIVNANGAIQDSCRQFLTPNRLVKRTIAKMIRRKSGILNREFEYDSIQPVDWVIGGFMMLKRAALNKVGLLDEGYFLYVEDMDWCKRFWDNGFQVVYYPALTVQYEGDRKSTAFLATGKPINKYTVFHIKSYLRFLRKHRLFW